MSEAPKKRPEDKFIPLPEREYLVTDQCLYEMEPPKEYNPLDPKRAPHIVQLVDTKTGTVVNLKSGSVVRIVSTPEK